MGVLEATLASNEIMLDSCKVGLDVGSFIYNVCVRSEGGDVGSNVGVNDGESEQIQYILVFPLLISQFRSFDPDKCMYPHCEFRVWLNGEKVTITYYFRRTLR